MSGICGIIASNNLRPFKLENLNEMMKAIKHRGSNKEGTFVSQRALLGQVDFVLNNENNIDEPLSKYDCVKRYSIVLNGELYNKDKLKKNLEDLGYKFKTDLDSEIILNAYIHYKEKCLDYLKGVYAFAIYDGYQLFLAKDRMGIKPLYYTIYNDKLIFASEIKALFTLKEIKRIITKEGFINFYGLGPTQIPGTTPYKDIYSLEPGQFIYYSLRGIRKQYYYKLPVKKYEGSFDEAKETVHNLVTDAVVSQLQSDKKIIALLSGGLDSSIICSIASKHMNLDTYSLDYIGNDKNFKENDFQRSRDNDYARLMSAFINSNHHECLISSQNLFDNLKNSMISRDGPGMADIDSSLYCFASKLATEGNIVLSGECADEVFGGYPWFYRDKGELFPWHRSLDLRIQILNKEYQEFDYLNKVKEAYENSINNIEYLEDEKQEDKDWRKMTYLDLYWFMQNLLHRKDSQAMAHGLSARVPFADHELVEFIYNLPKKYKYQEGQEKYILREAFSDELPYDIIYRKKNPYPKTFDPIYFKLVSNRLKECLNDESNILNKLFNKNELENIINNPNNEIPWFGQLMTTPQLIAYLLQFDMWVNHYKLDLEFLDK